MTLDLSDQTALELAQLYRDVRHTPPETVRACLDRIAEFEPRVNAFCAFDEEDVLEQAKRSHERWRRELPLGDLEGVPVAVKDVFDMRGWPNREGSRATTETPCKVDAPAVATLKRHGAILMGRTTTPEFGWKATTDSALNGVTRNPWDLQMTSGGSSGGSAAAVACGMAPLALGTDAGGSVRIPASFCGVVGHKPTVDRAPMWPPSTFAPLGHVGAIGWTVGDVVLLMSLLAEADWIDNTVPRPARDLMKALDLDARDLRIAYSPTLGLDVNVDPEIATAVEQAAAAFEELGALVEHVDPELGDQLDAYWTLYASGGANALRDYGPEARALLEPGFMDMVEKAEGLTMLDYMGAMNERMSLIDRMERFHRRWDLLLTPTVPVLPFGAGRVVPEGWENENWMTWTPFTWPFNMTGQPALSVPCGRSSTGLPIGLQLVGARWQDNKVLAAGHAYQAARPMTETRPWRDQ
ncbi:amidase [Citreimonas salinaria]|uniref:Aspartyl-tRNA(Asn)/glutamyl-tRNA(Gln) amidotransferase subunit A n=1 Tax=Citreimonas salinaria TaxID=321339 RepID=A0A1H3M3V9_9RHOB|nr:amidase [Citreimonas salinaria]SDY70984.1 aspartyl-tRNA(Asn)/glutamyl-tRNA(Gln) amidotransferase subunit A [Citreimonas salinaria]